MHERTTSQLQQWLQPLFELFRQPDVAIALALAIIAIAVLVFLSFTFRHTLPALLTLRRLRKRLRTIPNHDAFNRDFAQIDEAISSERLLQHGWQEFKETLIMPDETSATIRNTTRPSAYLNVGSIASKLELPLYQSLPNYFVGVGLLLTFCGLVAAIRFASEGVGGDVDQAKAALGDLLTAATFKFTTSIAGLGSSIALSIWFKFLTLRLQHNFDRLCELLEARLHFVTPEWLSVLQMTELRKQTVQLERFNTDFAVEVAKALETRFTASLGSAITTAVQPMVAAIDDMAKSFSNVNEDAMQQMVGEFRTSIQGAAGSEMTAIVGSLEKLNLSLEKTLTGLGETGGQFGGKIDVAAQRLEDIVGEAALALRNSLAESASRLDQSLSDAAGKAGANLASHLTGASRKLDEVVTPFGTQLGNLEKTLRTLDGRLSAQLEGFDGSVGQLRAVLTEFKGAFDHLRAAAAPIAQTADRFGAAANQVEASASVMKHLQASLTDLAKSVSDSSQRVQQSWESYRQRFEKVDEDLSATFGRIQEGTNVYHGRIREFVEQVDQHLTKALGLLGGGIAELRDAIEDMSETADKLVRAAA